MIAYIFRGILDSNCEIMEIYRVWSREKFLIVYISKEALFLLTLKCAALQNDFSMLHILFFIKFELKMCGFVHKGSN